MMPPKKGRVTESFVVDQHLIIGRVGNYSTTPWSLWHQRDQTQLIHNTIASEASSMTTPLRYGSTTSTAAPTTSTRQTGGSKVPSLRSCVSSDYRSENRLRRATTYSMGRGHGKTRGKGSYPFPNWPSPALYIRTTVPSKDPPLNEGLPVRGRRAKSVSQTANASLVPPPPHLSSVPLVSTHLLNARRSPSFRSYRSG